jgi:hypothetical protein
MSKHTLLLDDQIHFSEIYCMAKDQDRAKLQQYLDSTCFPFEITIGHWTPVSLLAAENDHKAVNFLLNEFNADKDDAVWGYAKGGHLKRVNELIEQGASKEWALMGYIAVENFHDENAKLYLIQSTVDLNLQQMLIEEFITDKKRREHLIEENKKESTLFMKFCNFFSPAKQTNEWLSELSEKNQMNAMRLEINTNNMCL